MSNMRFDFEALGGRETDEILGVLIEHITKSDEEIQEEAEEKDRTTELKIYVAENRGFDIGSLKEIIDDLVESDELDRHGRKFFREHKVKEEKLNEEVSYVEISTPQYNRTDQFIFLVANGNLRILTAERKEWVEKTAEKLIKYLPDVDRLYVSHSNLKELVNQLDKTSISGFTAKYKPYFEDKKVSIQFHGGDKDDLKEVEETFNAKPTRIEFSQRNSPAEAVTGSFTQHGRISFPRVREGSQDKGLETLRNLTSNYERMDRGNFEIDHAPMKQSMMVGSIVEGYTSVELVEDIENGSETDKLLREELEEKILDKKRRYRYSQWDENTFFVYDKENEEQIEVGIEGEDIVVHSREGTTSVSMRDFCELIIDTFSSTYDIRKTSKPIRG